MGVIARINGTIDTAIGIVSPRWQLDRLRARVQADIVRHYEGASRGRRTQGWNRASGDANKLTGPALAILRDSARDLVRNNGHAESGLRTIANHVVGWGIVGKPAKPNPQADAAWKAWAESTDCDTEGRKNFYGIQRLFMRTIAESGECLIRKRVRRPEDGLALPLQLQVLDPDYLDTSKTDVTGPAGGPIINGVEFDMIGRRVAYWLFKEHPGSSRPGSSQSSRIPAESIIHGYREDRPGQVRGISWFSPVLLKFKDFDEFDDATLMKQKIAACLAVIVTDVDGQATPLGVADADKNPEWDSLEPGMIANMAPGKSVTVVEPPKVSEYPDFCKTTLRTIAAGLGVTYEDMTGDYSNMPYSAARMSRLRHWDDVQEWRWQMLIPQLCNPVWGWAMQAAAMMGKVSPEGVAPAWTAPPPAMMDPNTEVTANRNRVRSGQASQSEVLRELGYDPKAVYAEIAKDNETFDKLGLVLDSDARKTSAAGLTQARPGGTVIPSPDVSDGSEAEEPAKPLPFGSKA
jgi:lambda family phage portal protein